MPLTLNVGISKKIGLPDYGSLGTSCHVEVELNSGLLQTDLAGFHQRVRQVYVACGQAVNDELDRNKAITAAGNPAGRSSDLPHTNADNGNGHNGRRPAAKNWWCWSEPRSLWAWRCGGRTRVAASPIYGEGWSKARIDSQISGVKRLASGGPGLRLSA